MMYAQESNAAARRAERKAQRDAERAKLRAEEQVQDMDSLSTSCTGFKRTSNLIGSQSSNLPQWHECFRVLQTPTSS